MKQLLILFFLFSVLTGCASHPKPIHILESQSTNAKWLSGLQVISASTDDDVKLLVYYDRSHDDYYVFNVIVDNQSDKEILVSNANFKYAYNLKKGSDYAESIDPEPMILEIRKKQSRENARYESEDSRLLFLSLAHTAFAIQNTVTRASPEEKEKHAESKEKLEEDWQDNEEYHAQKSKSINGLLKIWENGALRKTHLVPGYSIRGNVFFPIMPDLENLTLVVTLNDKELQFPYKIVKHESKIKRTSKREERKERKRQRKRQRNKSEEKS